MRVLLGVTGGIAAYKSAEIVRRLRERGAEVQVVMTAGARQFVTPLTFQALSGRPVRSDLWDDAAEAAMGHIELARWADRILAESDRMWWSVGAVIVLLWGAILGTMVLFWKASVPAAVAAPAPAEGFPASCPPVLPAIAIAAMARATRIAQCRMNRGLSC